MRRALEGERLAFDTLVRRHQDRAVAFSSQYLGDRELGRDAAQNAFIELAASLAGYQARGLFAAFWHRLLLNQCRMTARKRQSLRALEAAVELQPPSTSAPADDRLVDRQFHQRVVSTLGELDERLRTVIALRFSAELSLQEIADTLDIPLGTVKSRLFTGLTTLRGLLDGALDA